MTVNLTVKVDLSTSEDAALVERALCCSVYDLLTENPELMDLEKFPGERVLAIIEDVEVTAR